jgi:hypothetical protein
MASDSKIDTMALRHLEAEGHHGNLCQKRGKYRCVYFLHFQYLGRLNIWETPRLNE